MQTAILRPLISAVARFFNFEKNYENNFPCENIPKGNFHNVAPFPLYVAMEQYGMDFTKLEKEISFDVLGVVLQNSGCIHSNLFVFSHRSFFTIKIKKIAFRWEQCEH